MERTIKNEDDKVWVTISRTINLGNYESLKIDAGLSYTLKPKENAQDELDDLIERTYETVFNRSKEFAKDFKPKKPKYSKQGYDNCDNE